MKLRTLLCDWLFDFLYNLFIPPASDWLSLPHVAVWPGEGNDSGWVVKPGATLKLDQEPAGPRGGRVRHVSSSRWVIWLTVRSSSFRNLGAVSLTPVHFSSDSGFRHIPNFSLVLLSPCCLFHSEALMDGACSFWNSGFTFWWNLVFETQG